MRRLWHTLSAAAAAGGAIILTAGLAAPGAASAGTTAPAAGPVIATSSQAGYVTGGGRHFRFIQTTVTVPRDRNVFQFAGVVLGGNPKLAAPQYLAVKPGGGANSVGWSAGVAPFGMGGGALTKLSPSVGDTLRLSIYYDQHGTVRLTAVDTTKGVRQTVTDRVPAGSLYTAAEAASFETGYTAPVKADFRLWQFMGTHVTTYSGIKGTMYGPWVTSKIIATTPKGAVVMSPSALWNGGQNFGVYRR